MYGRQYENRTLSFEPSGGLLNSSLVLQDRETDSYWSIMTGDVIAGKLKGAKLKELPVSVKMKWKDWLKKHPNTLVLSVNGVQDAPRNVYNKYFESKKGYRGTKAKDKRLKTKDPIFAFQLNGQKFAVPQKIIEGGVAFKVKNLYIFLFRPENADIFTSTLAFQSTDSEFVQEKGKWVQQASGCQFDPQKGQFSGGKGPCPKRLEGFDTFWYTWSLTHPDTKVLTQK